MELGSICEIAMEMVGWSMASPNIQSGRSMLKRINWILVAKNEQGTQDLSDQQMCINGIAFVETRETRHVLHQLTIKWGTSRLWHLPVTSQRHWSEAVRLALFTHFRLWMAALASAQQHDSGRNSTRSVGWQRSTTPCKKPLQTCGSGVWTCILPFQRHKSIVKYR